MNFPSRKMLALSAALLPAGLMAAPFPPDCELSIYAPGAKPSAPDKRIVGPDQVASVTLGKSKIVPGGMVLQVRLTERGAAANRDYSSKHVGDRIMVLCNGKEIARPTIAGPSGATFVIEGIGSY